MKYAGTDRILLDRDLMTLKKALNNKVPVDESDDWRLPMIIEQFKMNMVMFQESMSDMFMKPSSSNMYRRLDFLWTIYYILVYNVELSSRLTVANYMGLHVNYLQTLYKYYHLQSSVERVNFSQCMSQFLYERKVYITCPKRDVINKKT
jgi:hypothetical protein